MALQDDQPVVADVNDRQRIVRGVYGADAAEFATLVSLSVLRTPVKVSPMVISGCWPRRRPCMIAVDRKAGSRWSARSAARTNDLDADKVRRMLITRG